MAKFGSLQRHIPYLKYKTVQTRTWASAGNTDTVTDSAVYANSLIFIMPTSAFAGRWYVTVSDGSFIVTSSDAENVTVTYDYLII